MLNICNQIFLLFLLTMMTGVLADILWWCLNRYLGDKMLIWASSTIRIVCLLYMVPIEFVLVNLLKKDGYLQGDSIW